MAKLDRIKVGDTLYDVGKRRWGRLDYWPVTILAVNTFTRCVQASWNGNPARIYTERSVSKWRVRRPGSEK